MNIRNKMLLAASALTLLPVILTAGLLWQGASTLTEKTLLEQTQTQLSALRDARRTQVQDEITSRIKSLQALAAQRSTIEAFKSLKASYATAAKDSPRVDVAGARARLGEFETGQFLPEFAKRNSTPYRGPTTSLFANDSNGVVLQTEFIVNNPNPLGQKEKLANASYDFPYGRAHALYHPGFERAQKNLDFYDLFLVDPDTDNIIYTVFKELDFASGLSDGIAARTKLAEAYQRVKSAKNRDLTYLSDFAPYLASYGDQAAFVGVPIFEQDRQIGVLMAQYPIEKLTDVVSNDKKWKQGGLGDSGDSYLVGPDKKLRTNARYMIEDVTKFTANLGALVPPADLAQMQKKGSTIGLLTLNTGEVQEPIVTKDNFVSFEDYRGVPSYGAVGPLGVAGLNWTVVTKINRDEANAPTNALNQGSLQRALLIGLGVLLASGALVYAFLKRFMHPIDTLSDTVRKISGGETAARTRLETKDEFGDLGRSFDNLLDERNAQLDKAQRENEGLNNSVIALLQTVFQMSNRDLTVRAPVTEDVVGTVSSSINQLADETARTLQGVKQFADHVSQLSTAVRSQAALVNNASQEDQQSLSMMSENLSEVSEQLEQVAGLSDQSAAAAENASTATDAALRAVEGTVKGMDRLRDTISEMEKRFKRLGERSQEITSAIALINTISERTHVLAVNASMQAATAGEAGRGFAVVATEVQRLSDNSRQATAQIAQLVGNIQADTNDTLITVNRLIGEVVQQSELARQAGAQMNQTQATTTQLVNLVQEIATFSQAQAGLASSLQQSVRSLNEGAARTSDAISKQSNSTETLANIAQQLSDAVAQFKLEASATPA